jgi:hypothetical protein
MPPGPLPPPDSRKLHKIKLPIRELSGPWFRSCGTNYNPIYYGKRQSQWRFDDPEREYGVLYVAEDRHGAFAESFGQLLSKAPIDLPRPITTDQLRSRMVSEISCNAPVRLVDLTGSGLARIGADSRLFAGEHMQAQAWSRALFEHPAGIDGILYPPRHDPQRRAAAIFEKEHSRSWVELDRKMWLDLGFDLKEILEEYGFALIESKLVEPARRLPPRQGSLFKTGQGSGTGKPSPKPAILVVESIFEDGNPALHATVELENPHGVRRMCPADSGTNILSVSLRLGERYQVRSMVFASGKLWMAEPDSVVINRRKTYLRMILRRERD